MGFMKPHNQNCCEGNTLSLGFYSYTFHIKLVHVKSSVSKQLYSDNIELK